MIRLLKGDFCECVFIILIICLQHMVVYWQNVPSTPIPFSLISDNTQLKKCTIVTICAMADPAMMISQAL